MVVTQCPECQALFRVSEGQIRLAQGQVRCGACLTVFNANIHALKPVSNEPSASLSNLGTQTEATLGTDTFTTYDTQQVNTQATTQANKQGTLPGQNRVSEPSSAPPLNVSEADVLTADPSLDFPSQGSVARVVNFNRASAQQPTPQQPAASSIPAVNPSQESFNRASPKAYAAQTQVPGKDPQHQPRFDLDLIPLIDAEPITLRNREQSAASPAAILFWTLCVLLGITALSAQYLWFERASLANQAALKPFYQIACERIPCDLNANQGLGSLTTDQVVVRPHQQFTDLISIAIKIRNEAAFAQPYPAIEVNFINLKGQLVSRRTFQPQQYLNNQTSQAPRLPAGLDIEVTIPLTNPGDQAVSYEIRLHPSRG